MANVDLLSTAEAAERVGVSEQTIRNWVKSRRIRHFILPSGVLKFSPVDVDAAVKLVEPDEQAS